MTEWSNKAARTAAELLDSDTMMTNRGITDNARVRLDELAEYVGSKGVFTIPTLWIREEQPLGTFSGTFADGADQTRVLNIEKENTITGASLNISTNQFTLPAGTYSINVTAPASAVGRHIAWLYNVTDDAVDIFGTSEYNPFTTNPSGASTINGIFTITETKVFEIRHRCDTFAINRGFGVETSLKPETYTNVYIEKIDEIGGGGGATATAMILPTANIQTASASASIEFLNLTGKNYELKIKDALPTTDSVDATIEVSTDNGSTWKSGSTSYQSDRYGSNSGAFVGQTTANIMLGQLQGNVATETGSWTINFSELNSTTTYKKFYGQGAYNPATGSNAAISIGGQYRDDTNAINAIRFIYSSGTIASGTFELWEKGTVGGGGGGTSTTAMTLPDANIQTASASASIEYLNLTGLSYELEWYDYQPATSDQNLLLQISTDNGATWETTGYDSTTGRSDGVTLAAAASTSSIFISLGVSNTQEGAGLIRFSGLDSTSNNKHFFGNFSLENPTDVRSGYSGGKWTGANTAINAIRLIAASGNITKGTFKLWESGTVGGGGGVSNTIAVTTSSQASVTLDVTGLSGDLEMIVHGRSTDAATDSIMIRFNGDTGNNYDSAFVAISGSQAVGGSGLDGGGIAQMRGQSMAGANALANTASAHRYLIPNSDDTTFFKTIIGTGGYLGGATPADANQFVQSTYGSWRSTAAVTSITVFTNSTNNFVDGTKITVREL